MYLRGGKIMSSQGWIVALAGSFIAGLLIATLLLVVLFFALGLRPAGWGWHVGDSYEEEHSHYGFMMGHHFDRDSCPHDEWENEEYPYRESWAPFTY